MDRGHKHTIGISEVCFYLKSVSPTAHVDRNGSTIVEQKLEEPMSKKARISSHSCPIANKAATLSTETESAEPLCNISAITLDESRPLDLPILDPSFAEEMMLDIAALQEILISTVDRASMRCDWWCVWPPLANMSGDKGAAPIHAMVLTSSLEVAGTCLRSLDQSQLADLKAAITAGIEQCLQEWRRSTLMIVAPPFVIKHSQLAGIHL